MRFAGGRVRLDPKSTTPMALTVAEFADRVLVIEDGRVREAP